MNTKDKDVGLVYLEELGIKQPETEEDFYKIIVEKFGKEYARDFYDRTCNRGEEDNSLLYEIKNKDLETSKIVTGMYNYDYFRQACNWFMENKKYIKGRVLDSCCDNGILTCFIASRFPECTIVGVDCVESSINVARELAESMGLTNVSFEVSNINNYAPDQLFDTIISSRSIGETAEDRKRSDVDWLEQTLREEIQGYHEMFLNYALTLGRLLKPEGYLIQIERTWYSQWMVGWQLAMNDNDFSQIGDTEIISAYELEDSSMFGEFVFKHEKSILTNEEIVDRWFDYVIKVTPVEKFFTPDFSIMYDMVKGIAAKAILERHRYEQEEGFIIRAEDECDNLYTSCGWLHMDKKTLVQYLVCNVTSDETDEKQRELILAFRDNEPLEIMLGDMDTLKKHAEIVGNAVEPHYFGDKNNQA